MEMIVTTKDELARKYNLMLNPKTGLYDCDGNVKVGDDLVKDGRLVIKFGTVKGWFVCNEHNLTSLEGAPQKVGGDFYCYNNDLTSLKGCPQKVGGDFDCGDNNLTSLEGAPQKIGGWFYCCYNNLTSLEGAPREVGGSFDCSGNDLTSLEGAPQKVGGNFDCSHNKLAYDEAYFYGFLPNVIGGELVADDGCDYELAKTYYKKIQE